MYNRTFGNRTHLNILTSLTQLGLVTENNQYHGKNLMECYITEHPAIELNPAYQMVGNQNLILHIRFLNKIKSCLYRE